MEGIDNFLFVYIRADHGMYAQEIELLTGIGYNKEELVNDGFYV